MGLPQLVVRLVVGVLMIGHGLQKLFGWFGGHGLEGTGQFFDSLGLRPGKQAAVAAGAAEVGGGALLTLGLATPLAVASLAGAVITGARTVHLKNGPWATEGGYEYNLVLLATLFALAQTGPGPVSVDAARGTVRKGFLWALLALAAGTAGSFAATAIGARSSDEPQI